MKRFLFAVLTTALVIPLAVPSVWAQQFLGEVRYRFEEGAGKDLFESNSGNLHGELRGSADFSTEAPGLSSGEENRYSLFFDGQGFAYITAPFIFNADGAPGDANGRGSSQRSKGPRPLHGSTTTPSFH